MISILFNSLIFASIGFLWVNVLSYEGGLLDVLNPERLKMKGKIKKLFSCSICMSGQVALWGFLLLTWHRHLPYEVANHIATTFLSMLITLALERLLYGFAEE